MSGAGNVDYRRSVVQSWAAFNVPLTGNVGEQVRQSAAAAEVAGEVLPPPLFRQKPSLVKPLVGPAGGGAAAGGASGFSLHGDLYQSVAANQPLQVELTPPPGALADAQGVVPVAFDGEFYYLAGPVAQPARQTSVRTTGPSVSLSITNLPNPSAGAPPPPEAERMRFNLWRGIKLGFFKLVGIPTAEVGLRVPSVDDGQVSYRPMRPGELATGRSALLVHGFLSDTTWMVQALLEPLQAARYDHVVTWDYETFTTPIRDTVADLARQLRAAGIAGGGEQIDVIAHSMGSVVSRSLIAQDPPLKIIRRGILMGAPNAGTPIAGVGDKLIGLVSLFLNRSIGPVSLGAVLRFLWNRVDRGMDDLQPSSDFYTWLNAQPERQQTPLQLVAGNAAGDGLGTLFERILHKGAELFYDGPNDLVVPVHSMESVVTPPYPSVACQEVACNHFDYLVPDRPGRPVVDRWIAHKGA